MAETKKTSTTKRTRKKAQAEVPAKEVVKETVAEEVKVEEPKAVEEPKEVTEIEMLKQAIEALKQQNAALTAQVNAAPKVIQISNDSEMVDFLWLAPVADDNELLIADGLFGKITGKVGTFSIPKKDLARMLDSSTRKFIENRWLIVLGGFSETERRQYGVDYKPGEVLDQDIFLRLLDYGDMIVPIYEKLCDASKDVVAKLYYEAWTEPSKKNQVKRSAVVAMHKIAPKSGLKAIIDEMNVADAG